MNLLPWPVYIFFGFITCLVWIVVGLVIRSTASARNPSRFQIAVELLLDNVRDLLSASLGEGGERHLPLVITLFLWILVADIMGQIPLLHSPTASTSVTIALGLISFIYVQYVGISTNGILGYLKHFVGPVIFLFWLFLPIEIIGELAKPFSLGMRLFGNIYGEDVINDLASKAGQHFFIPVQLPVYFLQLFTDLIQAVIFSLLTAAYISIFASSHHQQNIDIPHEDENEGDMKGRIPAEFSDPHATAHV
jgi:F-type H+-transporting ATPase subunit a